MTKKTIRMIPRTLSTKETTSLLGLVVVLDGVEAVVIKVGVVVRIVGVVSNSVVVFGNGFGVVVTNVSVVFWEVVVFHPVVVGGLEVVVDVGVVFVFTIVVL